MSHIEQAAHCLAAIRTIIQRALVDVHSDEFVGRGGIEVAGELHGIGKRFLAVFEAVLDTFPQRSRYG